LTGPHAQTVVMIVMSQFD